MKIKIILISILCVLLAVGLVYAYGNPLQVVESLSYRPDVGITKIYDQNNGVTCYIYNGSARGEAGISCIK